MSPPRSDAPDTTDEPPGLDVERALTFVRQTPSRFLSLAADWLTRFDDPVDLLFALCGPAGQALGPWETFRFCALLGLHPAKAVRELALDVLAEPLDATRPAPPIAPAIAIAHAAALDLDAPAAFAEVARDRLARPRDAHLAPPGAVACAQLMLTHAQGPAPDAGCYTKSRAMILDALDDGESALSALAFEAALLSDDQPLATRAQTHLASAQQPDGGLLAWQRKRVLRAYATLRVLALIMRQRARELDDTVP